MNKNTLKGLLLAAAGMLSSTVMAQQNPEKQITKGVHLQPLICGTTEYEALLEQENSKRPNKEHFEAWLAPKVAAMKAKLAMQHRNTQDNPESNVVTIPVVVHVINNGGPVGVEENISAEQIYSQITVLNQDFRREENTNGYNDNPVGADPEIEFCMAQRNPDGLASNGIDRICIPNHSPLGWDLSEVEAIKAQTQWDPEKYLNIWTFNMVTTMGVYELYGYTQFPTESTLDGLTDPSMATTADTDGIIIKAGCFGSQEIYPEGFYNVPGRKLGRTVTHEVGHFFGLRHIWGDENNCTADDYCADTPIAYTANQGNCPGEGFDSCPNSPGTDMFQNYMDYTNDACLNIFTQDQKLRMRTVIENSPRRVSLATANSCAPGLVYNNDGALNANIASCTTSFSPDIILHNAGNNTLTSATISYHVDNETSATYEWTGSLAQGDDTTISLPTMSVTAGSHTLQYSITTLNGGADEAPSNDTKSQAFTLNNYQTNSITVVIKTDNAPNDVLWTLVDSAGDEVFSYDGTGTPYQSNQIYTQNIPIDNSDCYTFLIVDTGYNGLCCTNGEGYYQIKTADGTVIKEGGEFDILDQYSFGVESTLGTDTFESALNSISIYPNPASNTLTVATKGIVLPDSYAIYNSLGQILGKGHIDSTSCNINISGFAEGVYFIKLSKGGSSKTLRFIKN